MRLSLRFLIPLVATLALLAYIVVPQVDALTVRWFVRDLDSGAQRAAAPVIDQLVELIPQQAQGRITALLNSVTQNERLYAIAFCDRGARMAYRSANMPSQIGCVPSPDERRSSSDDGVVGSILKLPKGSVHVARLPVRSPEGDLGSLVMVTDMSFIESRSEDTRKYTIILFLIIAVATSLVTVMIAHLSWRGWIAGTRALLRGEGVIRPFSAMDGNAPASANDDAKHYDPELRPLMSDLRGIMREIDDERRLRDSIDEDGTAWTPEKLRQLLKDHLAGDEIMVVSNREPYIHVQDGRRGRGPVPGERPRDRGRAGDARVLGHVDRARRRLGRPRDRRREGARRRAAERSVVHAAPHLAHARGRGRLLLRVRERGALAALSHRARAADLPQRRLEALRHRQPPLRGRGRRGGPHREPGRARAGLSLRAAAAPRSATGCRTRRSSRSGTSPGRTPSRSASARGARS